MSGGRTQPKPVLAMVLASLIMLSVLAVAVPVLGSVSGAMDQGVETQTLTETEYVEVDNTTTATLGPSTVTSSPTEDTQSITITQEFASQEVYLHGVARLSNIAEVNDPDNSSDNFSKTARLANVGVMLQVSQLNRTDSPADSTVVTLPARPTPDYDSPSAAAFAILDRYDVTPTAEQAANIRALDNLPESTRSELTDVLNAYLGYYLATLKAYAGANRTHLRALANTSDASLRAVENDSLVASNKEMLSESDFTGATPRNGPMSLPTATPSGLEVASVDMTQIRAAQLNFLEATVELEDTFGQPNAPSIVEPTSHEPVNKSVDVADENGDGVLLINLSTHDTTYEDDYSLLIDRGGDDTYNNNAGGASGALGTPETAALVDLDGNDRYNGKNGGGSYGAGFLLDASGDDNYSAGNRGTNGGGFVGIGTLLDATGDDTYTAGNGGTNGGGWLGMGLLLDVAGADTYLAGSVGVNGGARTGVGVLVDTGGNDEYIQESGSCSNTNKGCSQIPKGTVGAQVDLAATDPLPDIDSDPEPDLGLTTAAYGAHLCVEGIRNSCDGDGNIGQDENKDNDTVFGTIQAAVNTAANNQTIDAIEVRPDTYHEHVTVNTSDLRIVANHSAGLGNVTLDGGAGSANPTGETLAYGIEIKAADVTLDGFVIRNYTRAEITVNPEANRTRLRDNTVHGSVAVAGANASAIRNNKISQNNTGSGGLVVTNSTDVIIANNTVTGGRISLVASPNAIVANNVVADISEGEDNRSLAVTGTAATQSSKAGDTSFDSTGSGPIGISVLGGHDSTIVDNTVSDLSEDGTRDGPIGIAVAATTGTSISNNSVEGVSESGAGDGPVGIAVEGGRLTIVKHNSIEFPTEDGPGDGPIGIRFESSTIADPITHNRVSNAGAGGSGASPVGLMISDSALNSSQTAFRANEFASAGGAVIDNSTVAVTDGRFAYNITVVNSTGGTLAHNMFTGKLLVHNSTAVTIADNTFTGENFEHLKLLGTHDSTVVNNAIVNITGDGPHESAEELENGTVGVNITYATGATISKNVVSNLTETRAGDGHIGIKVVGSHAVTIENNKVEGLFEDADPGNCGRSCREGGDGPIGLSVVDSSNTTVKTNSIKKLSENMNGDGPIGLSVETSPNTVVKDNIIANLTEDMGGGRPIGIKIESSSNARIEHNEVKTLDEASGGVGPVGISIRNGTHTNVASNSLHTFGETNGGPGPVGISVEGGTAIRATNNGIRDLSEGQDGDGPVGMAFEGGTTIGVTGNAIRHFSEGQTGSGRVGVTISNASDITVANNSISGTEGTGLNLTATAHSHVRSNTFTNLNNSVVILSTTPSSVRITHNTFAPNGTYGVRNLGNKPINATYNDWGAPTGPSSPAHAARPLLDPVTNVGARGDGVAVSEGPQDGISNVHFFPYLGSALARGDTLGVEGTCADFDADGAPPGTEDTDGDDVYGTVQAAVDAASSGRTINVNACTYTETVTIDTRGLTLRGLGPVVLDGETTADVGVRINASNVTLQGIEIRNYRTTGIAVPPEPRQVHIRNSTVVNVGTGIALNETDATVAYTTVREVEETGIAVTGGGDQPRIHNSTVRNASTGIELDGADAAVAFTTLENNDNGTVVYGRGSPRLRANWLHFNDHAGLYLAPNATVRAIDVVHNRFWGNGDYGVHNDNLTWVLDATDNHWGSFNGPSSPAGTTTTLEDPETGRPANGTGDAVSAGATPGKANVHFDPYNIVHYRRPGDIDYFVDDDGEQCDVVDYNGIGTAVENAKAGDTILVCGGEYGRFEVWTRNLTIWGSRYPSQNPTISPGTVKFESHPEKGDAEGSTIRGFTITDGAGIVLDADDLEIIGNRLTGNNGAIGPPNTRFGGSYALIVNNTIINNSGGYICDPKTKDVDCPYGIVMTHNLILGNGYGIQSGQPVLGIKNTWACGGPSGGWRDPKTGRRANGTGDRISQGVRFDPFYEVNKTGTGASIAAEERVECASEPSPLPPLGQNNSAPNVEELSVTEKELDDSDRNAYFFADWAVNDSDGNLANVTVTLADDTDEETEEREKSSVSGESDRGSDKLKAAGDDGSAHNYTVKVVVQDEAGATDVDTVSIREHEQTPTETFNWPATATGTASSDSGSSGPGQGPGGSGPGGGQGGTSTASSGDQGTNEGSSEDSTAESDGGSEQRESPATPPPLVTPSVTVTASVTPPPTPTPPETPPPTPTPVFEPGFGVVGWVVAFLLLVGLLATRRRE